MMKKFYPLLSVALLITGALIFSSNSGGSNGGYSGSPANNGNTCTQCHSGTISEVSGWIASDIPEVGYTPGETYTITATLSDASAIKAGFELSVEDASGSHMGSLANIDNNETQLRQSGKSITHKSTSNTPTNGSKSWSFNWTAPSEAIGTITFYAAFNGANGNGNTSGDQIYKTSHSVDLDDVGINDFIGLKVEIYPNPVIESLTINLDQQIQTDLNIYDLNGRIVFSRQINGKNNIYDLSHLNSGSYILTIHEINFSKRILKQ